MGSGKVSVLLPVYNMEDTIEDSVVSVLNQKGVVFELIVVNDGSTDNTSRVLKKYEGSPNVRILTQSKLGKVAAFNRAYKEARGLFFVFFAGDDIMPQNSLSIRKDLLSHPEGQNSVSCGKLLTFSEFKKFDNILIPKKKRTNLSGGVIMFPRSIAEIIFPIPEELPNEDTWSRLVINKFAASIIVTDSVVLRYRIHQNNSIRKDECFGNFSEKLHSRMRAYDLFLEKFKGVLSDSEKKEITKKIQLEGLRYSGDFKCLFSSKKVPLKEKISNMVYSKKLLYDLKVKYYRFLSGWRS